MITCILRASRSNCSAVICFAAGCLFFTGTARGNFTAASFCWIPISAILIDVGVDVRSPGTPLRKKTGTAEEERNAGVTAVTFPSPHHDTRRVEKKTRSSFPPLYHGVSNNRKETRAYHTRLLRHPIYIIRRYHTSRIIRATNNEPVFPFPRPTGKRRRSSPAAWRDSVASYRPRRSIRIPYKRKRGNVDPYIRKYPST
jgi:hypothetical protein